MSRPLRLEHPGAVWHVTSRGNNKMKIYRNDADRKAFLDLVGEAVLRFKWIIHNFALMPNHFHLVIETPETTLSRGMQWLKSQYARGFNRKHKRTGHLFGGRFKGTLIEKQAHLMEVIRYVVLNPVRAGMVKRPEEYRWSSYCAAAGLAKGEDWLDTSWTLAQFGGTPAEQRAAYRRFVADRAAREVKPLKDAKGQLFLGSDEWIETMQAMVDEKPRSKEHPAAQRNPGRPSMKKIVKTVAETLKVDEEAIRKPRGDNDARRVVAYLGCYEGTQKLAPIAETLRLESTSRVSAMIGECNEAKKHKTALWGQVEKCLKRLLAKPDPNGSAPLPANTGQATI